MDYLNISPKIAPVQQLGKKPSKEAYEKAFDEWALLLFKQYRTKKRAELTEQPEDKKIDS